MKTFDDLKKEDELFVIENKTSQLFKARVVECDRGYSITYTSNTDDFMGIFDYFDRYKEFSGIDQDNQLTLLIPVRENSVVDGETEPKYWEDLGENSKLWVVDKKNSRYEIKEDRPFLVFKTEKWMVLLIHKNIIPIKISADSVIENENYIISISKDELCNVISGKLNDKINSNLALIEEYKKRINFFKQL